MSESENIAAAPPEADAQPPIDEEDRLRPAFVSRVLDAVAAGDHETARELVEPLHPADVADLIELAAADERDGLVRALAEIVDADVLSEMNEHVRETLIDALGPEQVASFAGQMETDDAVAILEDLEFMKRWEEIRSELPNLRYVVLMSGSENYDTLDWVLGWDELVRAGHRLDGPFGRRPGRSGRGRARRSGALRRR